MISQSDSLPDLLTRDEFNQGMQEQVDNIRDVMVAVNRLTAALNTQAEVLACHRYLLTRFIPGPILESAVSDYIKSRGEALDDEIQRNLAQIGKEAVDGSRKVH